MRNTVRNSWLELQKCVSNLKCSTGFIKTSLALFLIMFSFNSRVNKGVTHEDFDKKRSRAAIRAQALKEMEKEKEVSF